MTQLIPPTDAQVLALRPAKNRVDPWRAYAALVEEELAANGRVEPVATLFLTNRECPFRCSMCDLWRNTTDETVPLGAIPDQIDEALSRLPPARHIKLYNSGNFFDRRAIPFEDYAAIAERVHGFETVIVESHPRLCGDDCLRFRDLLSPGQKLEVAMGLETIHPVALPLLNKRMTCDDFAQAAHRLLAADIAIRTFLLLRPPSLDEEQGIDWCVRSLAFALEVGVRVATIIPTRGGNGWMERWGEAGWFQPPRMESLEEALDRGLELERSLAAERQGELGASTPGRRGRVFVDLWDLERLGACSHCFASRRDRLDRINRTQSAEPRLFCSSCGGAGLESEG